MYTQREHGLQGLYDSLKHLADLTKRNCGRKVKIDVGGKTSS